MKHRANSLRRNLSRTELMFLRRLTMANIASFDFQVQMGFYVADFVFPGKMLIVELDGDSHKQRVEHDTKRDRFLTEAGFTVWRVANRDAQQWNLARVINFQRPTEGRSYAEALKWANTRLHNATKGRPNKRVRTKEEIKERAVQRMMSKTKKVQDAEQERKEAYRQARELKAERIASGELPRVIREYLGRDTGQKV